MGCELAVEGSTRFPSLALCLDGGQVVLSRLSSPSALVSGAEGLLRSHGRVPGDVTRIHVCTGPGAYTALRVSLAFVQGLALVGGASILAYDATEILAATHAAGGGQGDFWVWNDARASMVTARPFRATGGECDPLGTTQCLGIEEAWSMLPEASLLVGSASASAPTRGHRGLDILPEASAMFRLHSRGRFAPKTAGDLLPLYLRGGVGS